MADNGGRLYAGKTIIRLKRHGDGRHQLRRERNGDDDAQRARGPATACCTSRTTAPAPARSRPRPATSSRWRAATSTSAATYSKPLTIAAANDVIVRPTEGATLLNGSPDGNIKKVADSDATLGLIANNFVRVGHKVTRSGSSCVGNYSSDGRTDDQERPDRRRDHVAAALVHRRQLRTAASSRRSPSTARSCRSTAARSARAAAARTRTGFLKDYWYDDRLRYRSPPYFLNPLEASWDVGDSHEQVPAR